jgi:hypothetical protein
MNYAVDPACTQEFYVASQHFRGGILDGCKFTILQLLHATLNT